MTHFILWLDQVNKADIPRVGGKGANLGELFQAKFPVPRAFCITASAYRKQVEETSIANELTARLAGHDGDYERLSTSVKTLFLKTTIISEIEAGIRQAYRVMGRGARVAVRSSATAEDLPEASFAGQQETFLGIHGEAALLQSVRECWASLWSAQAIHYREKQGYSHTDVALTVVVQEMVAADAAGVMFTVNPVNGAAQEMIVTASYGLGEAVVSGSVTPDTYTIAKQSVTIAGREVARKEWMVIQQEQGSAAVSVPIGQQERPCLPDPKILEIARIGMEIDSHYGTPQDIEWAVAGSKVYILQSRPITTLQNTEGKVQLPGLRDKVYGWVYLGRVPRFVRPRLIPTMVDHFPNPLRPFDIAVSVSAAMSGVRRVASDLGIRMPTDIVLPHPSGLILMNPPAPSIPHVLPRLPAAWFELKRWTCYNPLREWREVDEPFLRDALTAVPTQDLMPGDMMDSVRRVCSVIAENHYRRFHKYMAPGFIANRRLTKLLRKVDRDHADELKQKLTQGLEYQTAIINRETKALARFASRTPAVKEILSTKRFGGIYAAILADERCKEFLAELKRFLARFGSRTTTMEPQPSYPTWRDEPDHVLTLIGVMLRDPGSIVDDEQVKEEEYRQVRADIVRRLGNDPERIKEFNLAVDTMRGFIIAREATLFFFEECVASIRCMTEQLASFLTAERKLRKPEQLYYLLPNELEALIAGERIGELRNLAEERDRVWKRMEATWGLPEAGKNNDAKVLKGTGASQGKVTGTVKVIRGPQEFNKLNTGDILVCPSTNPAWTPLFSIASAVVAETGSVLSHAAIVAREYGIPAVMACERATQELVDGDHVEVDGSAGTVRKLQKY
ncbi:PEP/pyruvate-binding domain-containing protein [Paenibacillus validus]|uniref:PEP/pyruvate-binding domain-containing protein n=1 Tax=Paenibacillus validus TaxID=44253 RepID=UPI003D295D3F